MKTLSVKQPWASLIASGVKKIENRSWFPKFRGDILIASSKSISKQDIQSGRDICEDLSVPFPPDLPCGVALCVVKFSGVVSLQDEETITDHPNPDQVDKRCLDWWYDDCYGWILEDVRPVIPFPITGRLGLYETDDSMIQFTHTIIN